MASTPDLDRSIDHDCRVWSQDSWEFSVFFPERWKMFDDNPNDWNYFSKSSIIDTCRRLIRTNSRFVIAHWTDQIVTDNLLSSDSISLNLISRMVLFRGRNRSDSSSDQRHRRLYLHSAQDDKDFIVPESRFNFFQRKRHWSTLKY